MDVQISPLDPLIPIIIALVKQTGFPSRWNALLALGVYVIWTAVSLFLGLRGVEGAVTVEIFLAAFSSAAMTGYVSYQLFWRNLPGDIEGRLELATSFAKGPVSEPVLTDDEPDEEDI